MLGVVGAIVVIGGVAGLVYITADHSAPEVYVPHGGGSRLGMSTTTWAGTGQTTVASDVTAQITVAKGVALDASFPWAWASVSGGSDGLVASQSLNVGTVGVGGHVLLTSPRRTALSIGFAASIPTQYTSGSGPTSQTLTLASVADAGIGAWRYLAGYASARAPLSVEVYLTEHLLYRAELTPVLSVLAASGTTDNTKHIRLEHADELEYCGHVSEGVDLCGGFRGQVVLGLTQGGFDGRGNVAQTAVEPYVAVEPVQRGLYLRLGALTPLNRPLGFGQDGTYGGYPRFRAAVGAKF